MKKALVCGAGGFIGGHLVARLKREGYWVRGVDIKNHEYGNCPADEFVLGDLRDPRVVASVVDEKMDEVYQLAADMGGAGYIFTGEHDACVMHNSALCNLNVCDEAARKHVGKIFYSSSACIYPARVQQETENPGLREDMAYPAGPDSEYGWEKLFSERLYMSYHRNYGLEVHIARFHNIFGPLGTWCGGREKAPAAMCRKVAEAANGGEIEIWGDGEQTRDFIYVKDLVSACIFVTEKEGLCGVYNAGYGGQITINQLAQHIISLATSHSEIRHREPRAGDVRHSRACVDALHEAGFNQPLIGMEQGLRETMDFFKKTQK